MARAPPTTSIADDSHASQTADVDSELGRSDTEHNAPEKPRTDVVAAADEEDGKEYPTLQRVIPILLAMYLALFLMSLDRTIITTAIPQITDTFHSIGDIGWYASAYMITACAFQLLFGRIYTFYSPKWIFLGSVALFELGSLICGVAPNSPTFIVGRAVAGLGSAGIFSGVIVIMVNIIPLRKRPVYQGFMGAVFLIASVLGPLLGGAFTTSLSWRWCFYINLPLGGVTILVILVFLKVPSTTAGTEEENQLLSLRHKVKRLDPIGTLCLLSGVVCLLLVLQWGGSTYGWRDAQIIALLVLFVLFAIAFIAVQLWNQENATLPPRIVMYRSVTASSFFAFCISGSMTIVILYLPSWFQAIEGVDALESGIRVFPLVVAIVVSSIMAGGLVKGIGYYTPMLIACSVLMSIGAGLLTTFKIDTSKSTWIGYQVLFGFGLGLGQQQAGLAAQVVLPVKDVPTGVSFKFFGQNLGGAIFASVAQTVLSNKLVSGLADVPGLDAVEIVKLGATEIRQHVRPALLGEVLVVYNNAFTSIFKVALALACISLAGALLTEWKSVKGRNLKGA